MEQIIFVWRTFFGHCALINFQSGTSSPRCSWVAPRRAASTLPTVSARVGATVDLGQSIQHLQQLVGARLRILLGRAQHTMLSTLLQPKVRSCARCELGPSTIQSLRQNRGLHLGPLTTLSRSLLNDTGQNHLLPLRLSANSAPHWKQGALNLSMVTKGKVGRNRRGAETGSHEYKVKHGHAATGTVTWKTPTTDSNVKTFEFLITFNHYMVVHIVTCMPACSHEFCVKSLSSVASIHVTHKGRYLHGSLLIFVQCCLFHCARVLRGAERALFTRNHIAKHHPMMFCVR